MTYKEIYKYLQDNHGQRTANQFERNTDESGTCRQVVNSIDNAFQWDRTTQGHSFWANLNYEILN